MEHNSIVTELSRTMINILYL